MKNSMHDTSIREALHRKMLRKYHDDIGTRVIDEMGINHGTVRVDIAVANGILQGYEIKGEYDNLNRLPSQAEAYSKLFDKVTLVTCEKHLGESLRIVPDWWSVVTASMGERGAIHFSTYRKGYKNKGLDVYVLARLLWKDEALEILESIGLKGLRSKNRDDLYQELATRYKPTELRNHVCTAIKKRQFWKNHLSL